MRDQTAESSMGVSKEPHCDLSGTGSLTLSRAHIPSGKQVMSPQLDLSDAIPSVTHGVIHIHSITSGADRSTQDFRVNCPFFFFERGLHGALGDLLRETM